MRKSNQLAGRRRRRHPLRGELLEARRLLTAEGEVFSVNQVLDAAAIVGSLSADIDWGDGTSSRGSVTPINPGAAITVEIDYRYDVGGFFTPQRRELLQLAADVMVARFTDQLSAITPGGSNTWTAVFDHPSNDNQQLELPNLSINANEILIFAGAQDFPARQLGEGSFGGFNATGISQSFLDSVSTRGQIGAAGTTASDFGPWGGTISFDEDTNWYFGQDISGIGNRQTDFLSVAMHELGHVLGFGTAPSWHSLRSGNSFSGPKAVAEYDGIGNVPLSGGHWASNVTDEGEATLLDPEISPGRRFYPTPLDIAALDDIGWTVADSTVTVSGSHVYADNGDYDVVITLVGSEIGQQIRSLNAAIENAPPILSTVENRTVNVGQPISITDIGSISDLAFSSAAAGTTETFVYSIDWGDGTPPDQGTATIDRQGTANVPTLASFDAFHVYNNTGTFNVTVNASDDDLGSATKTFQISVIEPATLQLDLAQTLVSEDAGDGAVDVFVSRLNAPLDNDLTVLISSSDPTEVASQSSIVIPAGEETAVVSIDILDDDVLDGDQVVTITVAADGFAPQSITLRVGDVESLDAVFNASQIEEGITDRTVSLTIMRSNTNIGQPLDVAIQGASPRLDLPAIVTIPAHQNHVVLPINVRDDSIAQRPDVAEFTLQAASYLDATVAITILDDEPAYFQNPNNRYDVDGSGIVTALDALRILNELNRKGGSRLLDPLIETLTNYYDSNADYVLSPVDALVVINYLNRNPVQVSTTSLQGLGAQTSGASPSSFEHDERETLFALESDWLRI